MASPVLLGTEFASIVTLARSAAPGSAAGDGCVLTVMTEAKHNSIGHETDAGNVRAISLTGLALATALAIVFALVLGMFHYLDHHPIVIAPVNPLAETGQQQFPPSPRIDEHPAIEFKELRLQEDRILSTYGWVDKNARVVRIPIDKAMELQLKRGFPVRKEGVAK